VVVPTTPPPIFPPETPTPTPSFTFVPPPPSPTPVVKTVTSPVSATVVEVDVLQGQDVEAGQTLVVVSPKRFDVISAVPARLLDRFLQPPVAITMAIPDGPPEFACEFLSIGANLPTADAQSVLHQEVDLRCTVPEGSEVFPGLRGRVEVVTAEADDVIVLPLSAVRVAGGSGTVLLVEKGHPPVEKAVTLGAGERVRDDIAPAHQVVEPQPSPAPGPSGSGLDSGFGLSPTPSPTPSA
jgi:multidrug efflux pump subunit AcrA (membrane-fusion protein)